MFLPCIFLLLCFWYFWDQKIKLFKTTKCIGEKLAADEENWLANGEVWLADLGIALRRPRKFYNLLTMKTAL
jgi:hypothetical protein